MGRLGGICSHCADEFVKTKKPENNEKLLIAFAHRTCIIICYSTIFSFICTFDYNNTWLSGTPLLGITFFFSVFFSQQYSMFHNLFWHLISRSICKSLMTVSILFSNSRDSLYTPGRGTVKTIFYTPLAKRIRIPLVVFVYAKDDRGEVANIRRY